MKSRLPVVGCCLLTTLLVGYWLGQTMPLNHDVEQEIVERSTVSPFNSDGWQLASGQEFGPAATLPTKSPFERKSYADHPAASPSGSEPAEFSEEAIGPDVAYFPEVITETAGATGSQSAGNVADAHAEESLSDAGALSEEDAAVWTAELKDLPADQAEEILRLRQQLGSVASESLGLSFPHMPTNENAEPPGIFPELAEGEARPIPIAGAFPEDSNIVHVSAAEESPLATKLREEADRNYAQNIENIRTPGYKRRQIILLNVSAASSEEATIQQSDAVHTGAEVAEATLDAASPPKTEARPWLNRLDLREGKLIPTSNPLDIAISGKGWLKVERSGKHEFVRTGMLGFDKDGWLGIHTAAGLLPIVPKVQIPAEQQRLIIAETGEVYSEKEMAAERATGTVPSVTKLVVFNFRNASALTRTPFGTYSPTDESGDAEPAIPNTVRFLQSFLESSNVDRDSEIAEKVAINDVVKRF